VDCQCVRAHPRALRGWLWAADSARRSGQWAVSSRLRQRRGFAQLHQVRARPTVAEPGWRERARVLRPRRYAQLQDRQYARIVSADLERPGYRLPDLVGGLPDPCNRPAKRRLRNAGPLGAEDDPYRRIPIVEVYEALTGREAGCGKLSCPHRDHADENPLCSLGADSFYCHSCGANGGIHQLASAGLKAD
jgi:hypothetical protein